MNNRRNVIGIVLVGLLLGSLIGCSWRRDDPSSPTTPAGGSADQYGQFFATRDATGVFEWNYADGAEVFCVSFPEPGDYLLTYQTEAGIWHIVLRARKPAYAYVGLLPGDALLSVKLERGVIAADATPLLIDGDVERYATPSVPAVWWGTVFTVEVEVPMERGQGECRVIINTKKAANMIQAQTQTLTSKALPLLQKALQAAGPLKRGGPISDEEKEALRQQFQEKFKKMIQQRRKSK